MKTHRNIKNAQLALQYDAHLPMFDFLFLQCENSVMLSCESFVCLQDGLTGSAFGDFAIKQGSAWLAFENELGVQAPVGFWDPVGFTSDGDVATFKRRRSVELKHGRISMMATMGVSVEQNACRQSVIVTMGCYGCSTKRSS